MALYNMWVYRLLIIDYARIHIIISIIVQDIRVLLAASNETHLRVRNIIKK